MTVVVTGSSGLVGSEAVRYYADRGHRVVGIDNDMRKYFFGDEASTGTVHDELREEYDGNQYSIYRADIRDYEHLRLIFNHLEDVELILHCAAQPAHDWAAKEPRTDFAVNAIGTSNMLEIARQRTPDATFAHCSTSKVYGDNPNEMPLLDYDTRLDLPRGHRYYHGFDTTLSIDNCTHSLFGASKVAGDLLVQEYGRYFGMKTVCLRPGCISGGAHRGTKLHGFLSYMMRCAMTGTEYEVIGYNGMQVRCNIHASDLVRAFDAFHRSKDYVPGATYNIGGGRENSVSVYEAIRLCEQVTGRELKRLQRRYSAKPRIGDHKWWISDNAPFQRDHPDWSQRWTVKGVLYEIFAENADRWDVL